MSQLIDKLQAILKGAPKQIGFGAVRSKERPYMVLVADIDGDNVKADALSSADVILFAADSSAKIVKAAGDKPWGKLVDDAGADEDSVAALQKAGADFAVFSVDSGLFTTEEKNKFGRVLKVDSALSDSLLRTINELPFDALLIAGKTEGRFSWGDLMALRRFSVSKPLLAAVPSAITAGDLKAIWEAGIDGIVVKAAGASPETLANLRKEMDALAPRSRKRTRDVSLLFGTGKSVQVEEEHEEEEEEEEEDE
jgi:hypothetical protein